MVRCDKEFLPNAVKIPSLNKLSLMTHRDNTYQISLQIYMHDKRKMERKMGT